MVISLVYFGTLYPDQRWGDDFAQYIFLYRADVPFDNNASERALRNSVVHRKVNGGFRSEWGAESFTTVTTVVETAKRRGQQVLATLQELIGPPLPIPVASVLP